MTAGHDGRYNESYPEVFGRKLKSAMEAVGINFTVHNIAQGNNNCFPSNACYETMGGFDPDFVGWYVDRCMDTNINNTIYHITGSSPLIVGIMKSFSKLLQDSHSGVKILGWFTMRSQDPSRVVKVAPPPNLILPTLMRYHMDSYEYILRYD